MEEIMISKASELLQTMEQEGTPRKVMASITGYSYQQTCKFLSNECNPTTDFLNRLFIHTGDVRLIDLITSGRPVAVIPIDDNRTPLGAAGSLKELVELRQHELDREKYLLSIIADGKVDESDRTALAKFNTEFLISITHAYAIQRSINMEFEARAKK